MGCINSEHLMLLAAIPKPSVRCSPVLPRRKAAVGHGLLLSCSWLRNPSWICLLFLLQKFRSESAIREVAEANQQLCTQGYPCWMLCVSGGCSTRKNLPAWALRLWKTAASISAPLLPHGAALEIWKTQTFAAVLGAGMADLCPQHGFS